MMEGSDGAVNAEGAEAPELSSGILPAVRTTDSTEEASKVVREAVKRAPLPSLSGLAFEIMGLAWVFGALAGIALVSTLFAVEPRVSGALGRIFAVPSPVTVALALIVTFPLVSLSVRIAAGLARIASEGRGQGKGANALQAFRLGRRTQVSAMAIWILIFGMMAAATVVLLGPLVVLSMAVDGDALGPFGVVLSGLALTFALVYGAALGAVQELAMASLVRHERGTGSAILHAWRLIRNRRVTSGRMALVEMVSRVAIVLVAGVLAEYVGVWAGGAQLLLFGALVGGLRCQAWSLAYPRVGGLAPAAPTAPTA